MAEETKFPTEVIDLPSEGRLYVKESPLASGKLELKYMTAKEEDILTSQNLIKKGVVIDQLLKSLIVDKTIDLDDLILGDKNAIMVAARILAYGPKYEVDVINPNTNEPFRHEFNLADCPFIKLPENVKRNEFTTQLPVSKAVVKFKILNGRDERMISKEVESLKKLNKSISKDLTTRLKYTIISIDGKDEQSFVYNFVDNMLSRDSLHLRTEINKVQPDIDLSQEIDIEGEAVKVDIPMTADFFWPSTAI